MGECGCRREATQQAPWRRRIHPPYYDSMIAAVPGSQGSMETPVQSPMASAASSSALSFSLVSSVRSFFSISS